MTDWFAMPWLSLTIWVPILVGVMIIALSAISKPCLSKWLALTGALFGFVLSLPLFFVFDAQATAMQFTEQHAWIPALNIHYSLGVDGLSMLFIPLTSLITVLVVVTGWQVIENRVAQYFGSFLIMSGLIIGAFAARDAILFYAFFEAMLIPMYLIIGIWGGKNRVYAAIKFFLYTLMGSLLLLVAIIYLHQLTDSFEIARFYALELDPSVQKCLFMAFFLSFAVKVPMWPVHTWLPDAHVEAPTGGSMILAAITLKLGAYGFLRFAMPIAPEAVHYFAPMMQFFSLVAVVYIGAVALAQTDMKKLIAYSSIAHMGFVTLGLFVFDERGLLSTIAVEGAIMQMVSHGFVSAAMFMCIGVLYDRMHTRNIADYGGVANKMPVFASFFMLFAMANAGLPATSGFVGEFSVIMGVLQAHFWLAFAAALTLIFGAAYTLWMYKRVLFGEVANAQVEALLDVTWREKCVLTILAIAVLGMGIYPAFFSAKIHASAQLLIQQVTLNVIAP